MALCKFKRAIATSTALAMIASAAPARAQSRPAPLTDLKGIPLTLLDGTRKAIEAIFGDIFSYVGGVPTLKSGVDGSPLSITASGITQTAAQWVAANKAAAAAAQAAANAAVPQSGAIDTNTIAARPVTNWLSYKSYPNIPVLLGTSTGMNTLAVAGNTTQGRATGRLGLYLHASGMADLQQNYPSQATTISGSVFPAAQYGNGVAELSMPVNGSNQYQATTAAGYFGSGGSAWNLFYVNQGFTPKTCNVNNIDITGANQSLADWQDYASKLAAAGMTRCGAFEGGQSGTPNSGSSTNYDFTSSYWTFYKQVSLSLGGVALDTPPAYALAQGQGYMNHAAQVIQWANANGLRSSVVLAVYNDGSSFLPNLKQFVNYLKSNNALPTEWIVGGYKDANNSQLAVAALGSETTPGTLNEAALWLSKNGQVTQSSGFSISAPTTTGPAVPIQAGGRPNTQLDAADVAGLGARATQDDTDPLVAFGTADSLTISGSDTGKPVTVIASGSDANISMILGLKGAGYISTTVPGTSVYAGSTPGNGAIQIVAPGGRTTVGQVASGAYSTLIGGNQNSAVGSYATVIGGVGNSSQGQFGAVFGGTINRMTGFASGAFAGQNSSDRGRYSALMFASGQFSAGGDAQRYEGVLRGSTTSAAVFQLTADGAAAGSANCVNIPDNTSFHLTINLTVRSVTTPGNRYIASWTTHELGRATGASTTKIDDAAASVAPDAARTIGAWTGVSASIAPDQTLGCLKINVTPPTGNTDTIHGVARVVTAEVQ